MHISRIAIIIFLLHIFFSGCVIDRNRETDSLVDINEIGINGSLENGAGKPVVIDEMGAREFIPVDTAFCDDSGNFYFSFSSARTAFYALRYGGPGYVTLLIEPGEAIDFKGTYGSTYPYSLAGSAGSGLLQQLATTHKKTLDEMGIISRKNMELLSSPEYARLKPELDRKYDSISGEFFNYSLRFIHEHSGSLAILVALYNLYGPGLPVFTPDTHLDVYRFVDSALFENFQEIEAVNLLHTEVTSASRQLEQQEKRAGLQKGETAPDFVSSRPDGTQLALSDLKGNYVLLSFWAGWSKLSRDENMTLKKIYERNQDNPLKILQVSLDSERSEWVGAIEEDGLPWYHVSELHRWDSRVADLYYLEKIPSNVLIGQDGHIIDIDIYGEKLVEKIDEIFNH